MKLLILCSSIFGIGIYFISRNSVDFGLCADVNYECRTIYDAIENTLLLIPLVLFFSLLTYKLPPNFFKRWFAFAVWSVPIIFMLTFIIHMHWHHHPGGFMNMDDMLDRPIVIFLYSLFVFGSLIQLYRGYSVYMAERKRARLQSLKK